MGSIHRNKSGSPRRSFAYKSKNKHGSDSASVFFGLSVVKLLVAPAGRWDNSIHAQVFNHLAVFVGIVNDSS